MKRTGIVSGKIHLNTIYSLQLSVAAYWLIYFQYLSDNRIINSEGTILFLFDLSLTNRSCFPKITIVTTSTD